MKIHLFFSWQVETDLQGFRNKDFLFRCICDAIKAVENTGKLKGVTIEPHQGLKNVPGNPDVALNMYEQIDKYDIFIGDVTTVQKLDKELEPRRNKDGLFFRYGPNCNVFGEYNRALGKHHNSWQQIILLSNNINITAENDATVVPFDTRSRRWPIYFTLTDNSIESEEAARKKLMDPLQDAIKLSAIATIENKIERYYPFVPWFKQRNNGNLKSIKVDSTIIDKYKGEITGFGKRLFCITGKVGLEKTLLALSILEESELSNNCLYIDNQRDEYSEYKKALRDIFQKPTENQDIILIIDNCSKENMLSILTERRASKAGNIIIFLMEQNIKDFTCGGFSVAYYDVTDDFVSAMDDILFDNGILSQNDRDYIKAFCENKFNLVETISRNFDISEKSTILSDSLLTKKLLDAPHSSNERAILCSLSLFDRIGWIEERRGEFNFIITNRNITSVDANSQVLINEARAVVNRYIKLGLVEKRGLTISLIPKRLAFQLMLEWLESAGEQRLLASLNDINSSDYNHSLIRELHDQFKYLGESENSIPIVNDLLKVGSPFENLALLNKNDGALLFSGFAEINPVAACDLLVRLINSKNIDDLRNIIDGRRHLVWTIEKMAFRPDTFEKAAELLLRLGIAENEDIGNNATAEFIRLFPTYLPATAATLDLRLSFLQRMIEVKQYKPLVIRALKRALLTRDFILMGGAEKMGNVRLEPYQPSASELDRYIKGCLELVKNEYGRSTYENELSEILETCVIPLCEFHMASEILSLIEQIAEMKRYSWDKMQETMAFFKDRIISILSEELQDKYLRILDLLTPKDLISQFKRVEKESFSKYHSDFEARSTYQRQRYEQIAKEMYDQHQLDEENLIQLFRTNCINTYPFGTVLAQKMTREEQVKFVTDYVNALNRSGLERIDILSDFAKELNQDVFEEIIPLLQSSHVSYTLFAVLGRRLVKPSDPLFKLLETRIKESKSGVNDYLQYWTRNNINSFIEDDYLALFETVLSLRGFSAMIKMASYMLAVNKLSSYHKLESFVALAFKIFKDTPIEILKVESALHVAEGILVSGNYPELAQLINDAIIEYASQSSYFSPSYEMESIYKILMSKYFDVIWPSLSEALLSNGDHYWTYYNMKNLLGVDMVYEQQPIILIGDHFPEMLAWCDRYPNVAPARLAGMIQVNDGNGNFTNEAKILIDKYADCEHVLNELECSLNTIFSIGSIVPEYERRKAIYATMLNHSNTTVREWAQRQVNDCEFMIQRERIREQEKI